jgi:hypothetical protein
MQARAEEVRQVLFGKHVREGTAPALMSLLAAGFGVKLVHNTSHLL